MMRYLDILFGKIHANIEFNGILIISILIFLLILVCKLTLPIAVAWYFDYFIDKINYHSRLFNSSLVEVKLIERFNDKINSFETVNNFLHNLELVPFVMFFN